MGLTILYNVGFFILTVVGPIILGLFLSGKLHIPIVDGRLKLVMAVVLGALLLYSFVNMSYGAKVSLGFGVLLVAAVFSAIYINVKYLGFMEVKKKKPKGFKGAKRSHAHSMIDNNTQNKENLNGSFGNIKPQRIEYNPSNSNTTVQIILIGGNKETLKVNLTNTILEIYAHCKSDIQI
eukprot:UN08797